MTMTTTMMTGTTSSTTSSYHRQHGGSGSTGSDPPSLGKGKVIVVDIDHIGLVAYLSMQGINPVGSKFESQTFFWTFEDTEDLATKTALFESGAAIVDPKEYGARHVRLKRQMFAEIDRV